MYNEFKDEIWESLLKVAVIESSLEEIKDYASEKEVNRIVLPEQYDLKMRKLIKHYRYRKIAKLSLHYGKKIASLILLILGIHFTVLLSFKEVRTSCQNVMIHIYEKFI